MTQTSKQLDSATVARAFVDACRAELSALKPGNVHRFASGHGMEVRHFEDSAEAAAPFIADSRLRVGERILKAVTATIAVAGCNTNLGICLLAAPLARAAQINAPEVDFRRRLQRVFDGLDQSDADAVFGAIRIANPGGLSRVAEADVAQAPTISLVAAMRLAADRDRIARAYTDGFAEIFEVALPELDRARRAATSADLAVTTLHMKLMARAPDSHILRKYGAAVAEQIRMEAEALTKPRGVIGPEDIERLIEFDRSLKARGINPGTTADLVVATLFTESLRRNPGL